MNEHPLPHTAATTTPHPLNGAIDYAATFLTHPEIPHHGEATQWIEAIGTLILSMNRAQSPLPHAKCAAHCYQWLTQLGVSEPWQHMRLEYDRAKAKHGERTLDGTALTDTQRLCALVEELGEIARALTYDRDHAGELENEITQCGALALAWLTRY